MVRLLQSGWMIMLLGTLLFLGTFFFLLDLGHIAPLAHGDAPAPAVRKTGASWEFFDPEVDRLLEELKEEKLDLAQQREHLNQLVKRLEAERAELTSVTQTVHRLRADFDRTYFRVQTEEAKNLKRLAKLFATMEPATAVNVMDQLGEDEMAKLMSLMKDDQVKAILEFIAGQGEEQAKRAAALAGQLRKAFIEDAQP